MTRRAGAERVLVVDDSPDTLQVIERHLRARGYEVLTASDACAALQVLDMTPVDLVITDYKMPRISGMDLVHHVRENLKDTEVMMVTGYATVGGAVEAVKAGADEYLAKPFTEEELCEAVERALEKRRLRCAARAGQKPSPLPDYGLLGTSAAIGRVREVIAKAAQSSATVLITGESGTGKELVARAIHYHSPRASAPFVPVNCAGIPEGLLESELFGHVKGAFTGAAESRAGFFQTADGGSIFLDEISDTGLAMQAKLLRVLQDKEVLMLGSSRARKVDVRIIAATNKNLSDLARKGLFREDLLFRINVIAIDVPPLRERGEDVILMAEQFARRFAAAADREPPRFAEEAMAILRDYHWPGNVRELENVVQRLVVMSDGDLIEAPDLPSLMRLKPLRGAGGVRRTLAEVEAEHIRNVLAAVQGNRTRAAEVLGVDRKTLRRKLAAILGEDSEA